MTLKAAVIGNPIKHSLSPTIHGHWLKQYKIDGTYDKLQVEEEDLGMILKGLQDEGYSGVNITIPYKEKVYRLVDEVEDVAQKIGAVNTVVVKGDGQLFGTNTDAYGFIEQIRHTHPDFIFKGKSAVVLGAGGAARAVIYGLIQAGVEEIFICNRSQDKAERLVDDFALPHLKVEDWKKRSEILASKHILVNATALGMQGQPELDIVLNELPVTSLVSDIVYQPMRTTLLDQAYQRGHPVTGGLGMLIYQAVRGFELFFGVLPEVTQSLWDAVEER